MRRPVLLLAALAALAALTAAPSAQAAFGLHALDSTYTAEDGSAVTGAGAHPFAYTFSLALDTVFDETLGFEVPAEDVKDLRVEVPPGFVADRDAVPPCSSLGFAAKECPDASAVGTIDVVINGPGAEPSRYPVFSLAPPPGTLAKLGFIVEGVPIALELGLTRTPPYRGLSEQRDIAQVLPLYAASLTLWGVPGDPAHDDERGSCAGGGTGCEERGSERPFLTLPRSCTGPLATELRASSWRGSLFAATILSHGEGPAPQGMSGCAALGFHPTISARPSTRAAASASGLDFGLDVEDEELRNPDGRANSDIEKTVVTLPEGMTVNPSQAEGLQACSEAGLARETLAAEPGEGCPQAAKIGTIEVESPLTEGKLLKGSLFVAEPYANPFGSLIAVYVVIRSRELGVLVKQPIEVSPDARGRLTATAPDLPQLPFSHFRLRFREGARAPLISPPGCGTHTVRAMLYPWSGSPPVESTSDFEIISGPREGPCPAGAAPFDPGFEAGTASNQAGSYSPFAMRIARGDGEQDITRLSATLPPGVAGKIAGLARCPEAGIARAASRSGPHGGAEEQRDPSCPAASQIGSTLAGAGVGSQLTYVPGSLYLAGPYNGDPLSVVAIVPALAGPFDAGTVVVREALRINSLSGEVEVDGSASDPIPHILKGIPLSVRDLRVSAERPGFALNATSCAEESTRAQIFGGGTVLAPLADHPVGLSARYQAAGCRGLGFRPRLALRLKGGTRRGAFPALRAIVRPRPGQANFARAAVTLPRSAFLEQGHIRTICTRVQFAAGNGHGERCPKGSVYGHARAWSPLIEGPATGPVFLRSSNHNLPDLVVALKGPDSAPVQIELAARIDSVRGGIRSIFSAVPDLPVSRFALTMQGGRKGLIVNSRNLCQKPGANRARAALRGQNGRRRTLKPRVRALGCHKRRNHRRHRRR